MPNVLNKCCVHGSLTQMLKQVMRSARETDNYIYIYFLHDCGQVYVAIFVLEGAHRVRSMNICVACLKCNCGVEATCR